MFPGFLLGQFHNLATTDDGSLLIFSSALPMQGTTQFSWDKLFSIDSAGLKLYQQREQEPPAPGSMLSNYYLMRSAELSGDGGVSALITQRVCVIAGSSCFLGPSKLQSEVSGLSGQGVVLLRGQMRISRNGRYAFLCCDGSLAGTASLFDLNTMAVVLRFSRPFRAPHGGVHRNRRCANPTAVPPGRDAEQHPNSAHVRHNHPGGY
jgi:hypothetical protein